MPKSKSKTPTKDAKDMDVEKSKARRTLKAGIDAVHQSVRLAHKPASIASIAAKLEYGTAPESPTAVYKWLEAHGKKFGYFCNNQWMCPEGRTFVKSICPSTLEVLAETIQATNEDVDFAVAAARTAFTSWSTLSGFERAKHLYSVARHVQKHHRILAVLESLDNGKPIRESRDADVALVTRHFYHNAGWAQLMDTEMSGWKPVGVVAQIIPWNFPLLMLAWKIAPALAMGNTVVLKPASSTRLSALLFAEICAEAGIPPGVVNILTGSGGRMGGYLVDHPGIDKVAFTGSTGIGRDLRMRTAGSGKKMSLELGGKSPIVVFDNADLDSAVEGVVDAIWFNQGEVCCAGSRLLLQESIEERFMKKLRYRMDRLRVGHSLDKAIDMGPLVDQAQWDTVDSFVKAARADGEVVYQSNIPLPDKGYFYRPTVVSGCSPVSKCVREEIFGPVLAVLTFRSPEEAIALANNTCFGLGGSVWSENISLATEVALSIKAGVIWVNCHNIFDAAAGFGGYRESGFGREGGKEGLYEYAKPAWKPRPQPELNFPTRGTSWPNPPPGGPIMPPLATSDGPPAKKKKVTAETPVVIPTEIDRTPKMYIGGKQCRPDGAYSRQVMSPAGEVLGQVGEGNRKDIRNAVEAAHKAAPGWGKRAAHNRAQICFYIAENLQIREQEFAGRIASQTGRSLESAQQEVAESVSRLFYYAAYADKYGGNVQETTLYGVTTSVNEPVGVVGMCCPDTYPLLGFISLVAPAVVRGNTLVAVPSPKSPLCATDLYQVLDTSDLPGGVINIVTGDRDLLAKTLAEHQDIESIWFFGSQQGCANVEYAAASNMKRSFCSYGLERNWMDKEQGQGIEFLREAVEVKNIWIPMGECK